MAAAWKWRIASRHASLLHGRGGVGLVDKRLAAEVQQQLGDLEVHRGRVSACASCIWAVGALDGVLARQRQVEVFEIGLVGQLGSVAQARKPAIPIQPRDTVPRPGRCRSAGSGRRIAARRCRRRATRGSPPASAPRSLGSESNRTCTKRIESGNFIDAAETGLDSQERYSFILLNFSSEWASSRPSMYSRRAGSSRPCVEVVVERSAVAEVLAHQVAVDLQVGQELAHADVEASRCSPGPWIGSVPVPYRWH